MKTENQSNSLDKLIIALGCISIGCLVGCFAYPLQGFEIWKQIEVGAFNQEYAKTFILTDSDIGTPYGLNKSRAVKISSIYNDSKLQKMLLLATSLIAGTTALIVGNDVLPQLEIKAEVKAIDLQAKKEFLINQIKHKWAMASQSQKLQFREELQELAALFPDATLEASEINETDKFINASYLLAEGHEIDFVVSQVWGFDKESEEHFKIKEKFQSWLGEQDS